MKYAYNNNGILQDVIKNDPTKVFVAGYASQFIEVPDEVDNGWVEDVDGVFKPIDIPLLPSIPLSVTQRQGRIILDRFNLLTAVEEYFSNYVSQEARIEFEYADEWRRDWPLLVDAAHTFGLTDAQIDEMFIQASLI